MDMKPIETVFDGYKFRSRLEARWAVFFTEAGIPFEYEPEGFDIAGVRYLPDFWLPEQKYWLDIKPKHIEPTDAEKMRAFSRKIRQDANKAFSVGADPDSQPRFYVISGDPYYREGKHSYEVMSFRPELLDTGLYWTHCPLCDHLAFESTVIPFDYETGTEGLNCTYCDLIDRNWKETPDTWFHKGVVETRLLGFIYGSPRLMAGYNAARQARFEHGEKP